VISRHPRQDFGDLGSIEKFEPALRRFFAKRGAGHDTDDLVQEVFLKMQSRKAAGEITNLQGYVFTVAANVLKQWRQKMGPVDTMGDGVIEIPDVLTPERVLSDRRDAAQIISAIEALPPRTREVFVAHRFEDMTYSAIAANFGISVSAVEKHIILALQRLSAALAGGR
jgi:RNA polymerase sigma-70 factor (ECF subfamily)